MRLRTSKTQRGRPPQVHSLSVTMRFRRSVERDNIREGDARSAFWRTLAWLTAGPDGSYNKWRLEAPPEVLEAEFERILGARMTGLFSHRFLGEDHPMRFPAAWAVPSDFFALVKKVSFTCKVSGYSSINFEVVISGFQALAEIFDRDFESFRVFFEPFLFGALGDAYNASVENGVTADLRFSADFREDFERPLLRSKLASAAAELSTRLPSDAAARAQWLWRLANGSLLVPVVLALVILIFGGMALRDLHRAYVDGLARLLEVTLSQQELMLGNRTQAAPRSSTPVPQAGPNADARSDDSDDLPPPP